MSNLSELKVSLRKEYGDLIQYGRVKKERTWGYQDTGGSTYQLPVTIKGGNYLIKETIWCNPYSCSTALSLNKNGERIFDCDEHKFIRQFDIFMQSLTYEEEHLVLEVILPDIIHRDECGYSNADRIQYNGKVVAHSYDNVDNLLDNIKLLIGGDKLEGKDITFRIKVMTTDEEDKYIKKHYK